MPSDIGNKISVCLLTYNHANVIESTLASILKQTVLGYEVIVSDDCSDDGTWEKILKLASADSRIKPLRTPRNLGMPGNANFAVANSGRPYIALLHHDDLYREDLLEKWGAILEQHPNATFAFNPYGAASDSSVHRAPMPGECFAGKWLLNKYLLNRWGCVVRGTAMIRRDVWEQVGGMRERFGLVADIDLWMRLSMRGDVGYVDASIIIVRDQRPSYYPEIYKGSYRTFWQRQRLVYDVHSANWRDYLDMGTIYGNLRWARFRWRLSSETVKWLLYAYLRKKHSMLTTSGIAAIPEEYPFVGWLRTILSSGLLKRMDGN